MATFNNIQLEEASTVTHRMATVTIDRGGVLEEQEVLVVGDPESSLALAGVLNTTPASTQFGIVVREAEPTTTVNVSSLGGRVLVDQNSTVWPVQVSSVSGTVQVTQVTSSGADITDSTNGSIKVTVVEQPAGGSTQVAISSGIVQTQQITSSGADLTGNASLDTSAFAISVRNVSSGGGAGSTIQTISTGSVRVHQSSAADLNVTVAGYVAPTNSTIHTISTVQGRVYVGSTQAELKASVYQSTASELNVTVAGYVAPSTTVQVSSGTMHLNSVSPNYISSGHPIAGSSCILVQENIITSTYVSGTLSSAESTIILSLPNNKICVYAMNLSVNQPTSQMIRIVSASTNEKWRMYFNSSAISMGAVLSVNPPQFLFRSDSNQSIAITSSGGSANVTYAMSYFLNGISSLAP
jgi:hypothetical protein